MIVKMIPQLRTGYILKRSMLTAIADAALMTDEYLLKGYADGILSGCMLTATKDAILMNEGAVFLDGQIFLIKEPMAVNYRPTNTTTVLKMCFADATRNDDCVYREMNLVLTGSTECGDGEIELCRFKLQEGAVLRCSYQDFGDRSTEFDTMNRVHSPYASYGQSTLAPDITRAFAEEMLDTDALSDFDAAFCLQILGRGEPVAAGALIRYIERTGGEKPADTANMTIYRELAKILDSRRGAGRKPSAGNQKKWKMIME